MCQHRDTHGCGSGEARPDLKRGHKPPILGWPPPASSGVMLKIIGSITEQLFFCEQKWSGRDFFGLVKLDMA